MDDSRFKGPGTRHVRNLRVPNPGIGRTDRLVVLTPHGTDLENNAKGDSTRTGQVRVVGRNYQRR